MDIIELKATDLAAMLCSRVCHDLINPIGAIGNGLEVLSDPSQTEMAEGARDLIASAAKQSRAKLEFARLAYGASSTAGTDIDTRECERVARIRATNSSGHSRYHCSSTARLQTWRRTGSAGEK